MPKRSVWDGTFIVEMNRRLVKVTPHNIQTAKRRGLDNNLGYRYLDNICESIQLCAGYWALGVVSEVNAK